MSETKHTPGPWALAWEDGKHGVMAAAVNGKLVAIIANNDPSDGKNDERRANGLLMSASPEMLKLLKSLDRRWSSDFVGPDNPAAIQRFTARQIREWVAIRAAIAKAEGRTA